MRSKAVDRTHWLVLLSGVALIALFQLVAMSFLRGIAEQISKLDNLDASIINGLLNSLNDLGIVVFAGFICCFIFTVLMAIYLERKFTKDIES